MKRIVALTILLSIFTFSCYAQKISTQKFLVRKITFTADDPIVPISGVSVEINKANFRSDRAGHFTANIPVSDDNGFYISKISAPGYIVSIPEDLKEKLFITPNKFVIVLADPNAVKTERDRIRYNHQVALAKQEEQLKAQVKKNVELLSEIELKDANYKNILEELEKAKQQLESFKNAKVDIEEKIDTLSNNLAMVDFASLGDEEKRNLEKQKQGEWISIIVDDVLSQLEKNLNTKYDKEVESFQEYLKDISNDYYQKFINGNKPSVINFFAYKYGAYLNALSIQSKSEKDNILDRMLDKIIEEDLYSILDNHIDECRAQWKVQELHTDYNDENSTSIRTLESAKEDFLKAAMYPDRAEAISSQRRKFWRPHATIDYDIANVLIKVYNKYYTESKRQVKKLAEKYITMTDEERCKLESEEYRRGVKVELDETLYPIDIKLLDGGGVFAEVLNFIITEEVIEQIREKYNAYLEKEIEKIEKSNWESIISQITPISPNGGYSTIVKWKSDKYFENDNQEYAKYKKDYPIYTDFLYSIVMIFMQPIIDKYDSDLALKSRQSDMEDDVHKYCFLAIKRYSDLLSYIPNVPGSNDECLAIVRTIVAVEKEKMIKKHNERIEDVKENQVKSEIANLKEAASKGIKSFSCEKDILTFLAIYKFITDDESRTVSYDNKISKYCLAFSDMKSSEKISCQIFKWTNNSADLMIINERGSTFVVTIRLDSANASYTEIENGGKTIVYKVVAKEELYDL